MMVIQTYSGIACIAVRLEKKIDTFFTIKSQAHLLRSYGNHVVIMSLFTGGAEETVLGREGLLQACEEGARPGKGGISVCPLVAPRG